MSATPVIAGYIDGVEFLDATRTAAAVRAAWEQERRAA
jgi:hypothetical protein